MQKQNTWEKIGAIHYSLTVIAGWRQWLMVALIVGIPSATYGLYRVLEDEKYAQPLKDFITPEILVIVILSWGIIAVVLSFVLFASGAYGHDCKKTEQHNQIITNLVEETRVKTEQTYKDTELMLIEERRKIRAETNISRIPIVLSNMNDRVEAALETLKTSQIDEDTRMNVLTSYLGVNKDNEIFSKAKYNTERQFNELENRLKKTMGISKNPNIEETIRWGRKIGKVLDDNGVGLNKILLKDEEYKRALTELTGLRTNISYMVLDHNIENYLSSMYMLQSFKLFIYYSDIKSMKSKLPKRMLDFLDDYEPKLRTALIYSKNKVNEPLEIYRSGERVNIK